MTTTAVAAETDFRSLKRLIAQTFPDIHWEVYEWHRYTGSQEVWEEGKTFKFYGGFVDGWAYNLPGFKAEESRDEQAVVDAIHNQIERWWIKRNPPSLLGKLAAFLTAKLSQETGNG